MKLKLHSPEVRKPGWWLSGLALCGCLWTLPATAAPVISGSHTQNITDKQNILPFDNLSIATFPAAAVTVTITFPAAQGALTPLQPFFSQSADTYTLSSTNASGATAFLKTLTFTPMENRVPVGDTETTTFTIIADDGAGRD
ncbi:MAG TPA: hypothetical protein VKI65_08325, partial [Gemmataceae bacterium]|nr:hypothetical protein [Gemmataceae bacterium]